jgi:hypothetical protein
MKKTKHGVTILSLEKREASVDLRAKIPAQETDEKTKQVLAAASLWFMDPKNRVQDNVSVPERQPVLTDDRYVFATFRALSQIFLEYRGLDFSTPGVLEASVPLLQAKTVYPNHDFQDIYNWLGVVSNSFWDAAGENSGGVPGINCEIKIDAFLNYRIACGLMMTPPSVNSMSLTVNFAFEYSHPDLAEQGRFWQLLGEEVDDEIVRLIVVNIIDFWEASLVAVGEDRLAKNHGARGGGEPESDDVDFAEMSAEQLAAVTLSANSNEEKTMKLSKEKKEELGIEFDGEDVPETEIFKAAESHAATVKAFGAVKPEEVENLRKRADAGDKYIELERSEVTRLAKLAELGADEGDLPAVVANQIKAADFDTLVELEKFYGDKVAKKFPNLSRSSKEDSLSVDAAGGVDKQADGETVPESRLL